MRFSNVQKPTIKRIENKRDVYRGKDCMKRFCESLRERNEDNYYSKEKK